MRDTTIARSYAVALYDVGDRHGLREEFATAFDELQAVLDGEPSVRLFLETPKVEPEPKKRVLEEALRGRVPDLFLNFLMVVLDKRRQRLIRALGREYHAVLDERLGRVHVEITLAREADDSLRAEIRDRLERMTGRTVIPHFRANPDIIGGIIVRYGDRVLDGSVRRRLVSMRRQLLEPSRA